MSYDADWPAIRARIKAAREARGWTQRELAERLGVTTTRVGQIESVHAASEAVLARIAEALGRSVAWLRYGIGDGGDLEAAREDGYRAAMRDAAAQLFALAQALNARAAAPMTGAADDDPMSDDTETIEAVIATATGKGPAGRRPGRAG